MAERKIESLGPKSKEVIELLLNYEVFSEWAFLHYMRPVVYDSAEGCFVKDVDGKKYLDFTSAFATAIAGHTQLKVVQTLVDQAKKITHAPDSPTLPRALLAKRLSEVMPKGLRKSMFGLGGGDAVEIAIKLVRTHKKLSEIIGFIGGFHGRGTFGCLSATSVKESKKGLHPIVPGFYHIPYAYCYRCAYGKSYPECDLWCAKYLEFLLDADMTGISEPGAVIVEPVQGAGGYVVPPDGFLPELRKITKNHDLLLIVDEIQTAFGRYGGAITASEALNIIPDIITLGKGLTGGFPLSATVTTDEISSSWTAVHSATYTGNPLMCAVALTQLEVVQDLKLPERVRKMEPVFRKTLVDNLSKLRSVGDFSAKGLFSGVEIVEDRRTKKPARREFVKRIADIALEKGLIILPCDGIYGNRINLAPPLTIEQELIEEGVHILRESIAGAEKGFL